MAWFKLLSSRSVRTSTSSPTGSAGAGREFCRECPLYCTISVFVFYAFSLQQLFVVVFLVRNFGFAFLPDRSDVN